MAPRERPDSRSAARLWLGLASVLCAGACVSRPPTLEPGTHALLFARPALLDEDRLEMHLVRAAGGGGQRPLLLYATGDGGWRSADRGLFQHLARWGYPVAGFSARRYLEHLRFEATTPARVAVDYRRLIGFARKALELPSDRPTVLVGFSRGSSLAMVAAGESDLQPLLGGVLAVALGDEEEYVRDHRARHGRGRGSDTTEGRVRHLRPYDQLPRLGDLPLVVIQSTQDDYLPAARAQTLFGPNGERRRFYAIRAGSHTFCGARNALYEQARVALEWIVDCPPRAASGPARRDPSEAPHE